MSKRNTTGNILSVVSLFFSIGIYMSIGVIDKLSGSDDGTYKLLLTVVVLLSVVNGVAASTLLARTGGRWKLTAILSLVVSIFTVAVGIFTVSFVGSIG